MRYKSVGSVSRVLSEQETELFPGWAVSCLTSFLALPMIREPLAEFLTLKLDEGRAEEPSLESLAEMGAAQ